MCIDTRRWMIQIKKKQINQRKRKKKLKNQKVKAKKKAAKDKERQQKAKEVLKDVEPLPKKSKQPPSTTPRKRVNRTV